MHLQSVQLGLAGTESHVTQADSLLRLSDVSTVMNQFDSWRAGGTDDARHACPFTFGTRGGKAPPLFLVPQCQLALAPPLCPCAPHWVTCSTLAELAGDSWTKCSFENKRTSCSNTSRAFAFLFSAIFCCGKMALCINFFPHSYLADW